jgi:hypothetical protein
MIELLGAAVTKLACSVLVAAVEGRDVTRADASGVISAFLGALVQQTTQTNEALERLEGKVDALARQPYPAAVAAGYQLLADAAPARRKREDRAHLLAEARTKFAEARGYATTAVERDEATVLYGMTWLAAGSPEDALDAFAAAARVLEDEALQAFADAAGAIAAHHEREQRRRTGLGRVGEALFGHDPGELLTVVGRGSGSDRLWAARDRLARLQAFRGRLLEEPWRFPALKPPPEKGWDPDIPGARLWVPLSGGRLQRRSGRASSSL